MLKGAKPMEKAVIVGQRGFSIANGQQLNGFPDDFGNRGNVILRCSVGDERQEAVGGVPVAQQVGKGFLPFKFIRPDDRFVFADRIVDYYKSPGLRLFLDFVGGECPGSDINLARNGPLLPDEQRNGKLCEPEKQYKSSFCHDADKDQFIEKFILL